MSHFIFHFNAPMILLLIIIAASAGLIDTLAGGGSLISVPALLAMGLPPALALGTSKFQSCIGELNATMHFIRSKKVNFKNAIAWIIFCRIGINCWYLLDSNNE